jgi:hypothetical protein
MRKQGKNLGRVDIYTAGILGKMGESLMSYVELKEPRIRHTESMVKHTTMFAETLYNKFHRLEEGVVDFNNMTNQKKHVKEEHDHEQSKQRTPVRKRTFFKRGSNQKVTMLEDHSQYSQGEEDAFEGGEEVVHEDSDRWYASSAMLEAESADEEQTEASLDDIMCQEIQELEELDNTNVEELLALPGVKPKPTSGQDKGSTTGPCFSKFLHGVCKMPEQPCKFDHSEKGMLEVLKIKMLGIARAKCAPKSEYILKMMEKILKEEKERASKGSSGSSGKA